MAEFAFAIPGDPDQRTGGYLYDRRLAAELPRQGWQVRPVRLPDGFPFPDAAELAATDRLLADLPDDMPVMVDGLAFGAMPEVAARHAARLRLVALVHHPLGYETGLSPQVAERLVESERAALGHARHVVVTSTTTAQTLATAFSVAEARLAVALPGTDPLPAAVGSGDAAPALLAVGSVLPRKDFPALVDALASLGDLPWRLVIAGSLTRDPFEADRLRATIRRHGLSERVTLAGEVAADELRALLHRSDLFVSSSRYEGFGMALAEAAAAGLPVVAVAGGAVADWMHPDAAVLVPPDRPDELALALSSVLAGPDRRHRLRTAALTARARLPDWAACAAAVAAALDRVARA
ncbi:glycosyltransferase family 4 protein [Geminicoccus flavidas]|uniref:glycosyltransferase family 4 protein n=1 Tax=Geminicoccus flavidas TaxID=2506407 RepID=UPI001F282BDA|nr:glycosyltransferase family 4 protein [Geminicoccus flavidas]